MSPDQHQPIKEAEEEKLRIVECSPEKDDTAVVTPDFGDRYEVLDRIGQGGMGTVYRVKDKDLDKTFAIKLLRYELARDKDAVKRFKQEAEAAARLTHANLGTVYTHGQSNDGAPYLVMDYLEGESLSEILRQQTVLKPDHALELFIQVCDGLEHAHLKGVIHRDLKPSNIIISKSPAGNELIHLVDFGIAKVLSKPGETLTSLTQTGEIFGSPLYMSPEQCEGGKIDERSDIYSFGCVMYECLVGEPPFPGNVAFKVMMKQVSEPAPDIMAPHVPDALKEIISICLSKDPSLRYESIADLRRDLFDISCNRRPRNLAQLLWRRDVSKTPKGKEPVPYKVQKPPLSNVWIQLLLVSIFAILCILLPGMFFFWPAQEEVASQNARLTDLRMKAVDYYGQGQYKKAIPFFEMAAYGHRDELPDVQLTFLLQRLGYCYEQTGDIEKALLSYKNAAEVARDNRVGANTEPCLRNYARMLRSVNRIEEAKSIEKEADAAKLELMRLKKQYPGHHYFK